MVCVWLQIQAQPRSDPLHPLTVMYLPSFLPFPHSFYSFVFIVPPPFSHVFLLTISPLSLHLLLAPLAFPVADALDSVVVSSLRHNLRLLGGASLPVALWRRHSVCAHYRHNLLLSPVSKPNHTPPPPPKNNATVRAAAGRRGREWRKADVFSVCNPVPPPTYLNLSPTPVSYPFLLCYFGFWSEPYELFGGVCVFVCVYLWWQ